MKLTESVILKRRRNKENVKLYHSIIPCIIVVIANIFLSFAIADEKFTPAGSKQRPEIFVQLGHSAAINATAFSPDGKFMASGGVDKTIKLWEVSSGRELKTLTGHEGVGGAIALSFSKDGKSLASIGGSFDQTIRIWDVASGKETFKYKMKFLPSFGVKIARFSHDAKYVVVGDSSSGDRKATIKVIETETGREVRDFSEVKGEGKKYEESRELSELSRKSNESPDNAIFSPDGKKILLVFQDSMKLLDIASGNEIRTFPTSSHSNPAAFSPDGKLILVGMFNTFAVFDVTTGRTVVRFEQAHPNSFIGHVSFSPDGKYAVTTSKEGDGAIKLWDIQGKKEARAFTGHGSRIESLTFSPSGSYFVTGGFDNAVKLWNIHASTETRSFSGAVNHALSVDVSPDGRYVLSVSGREVILWNMATGMRERVFKGHVDVVNTAKFSPDGKYAMSASGAFKAWKKDISSDNSLRLWEIATGKEIRKFTGHTDGVLAIAFSPDGRFVLSGGYENTARMWDVATGTEIRRIHNSILVEEKDYSGKRVTVDKGGGFYFFGFSKDGKTAVILQK